MVYKSLKNVNIGDITESTMLILDEMEDSSHLVIEYFFVIFRKIFCYLFSFSLFIIDAVIPIESKYVKCHTYQTRKKV